MSNAYSTTFKIGATLPRSAAKPRIRFESCPLCQSAEIKVLRTADCSRHANYNPIVSPTMTWMRCGACEHVFTQGYFPSEVTDVIFAKTHENQVPGWSFEQQRYISARMVQQVVQHISGGRSLDVGFGNGSLLFTAEEFGFDTVGIDLRKSSAEAMKKLGFEAHCADLEKFGETESISVISMADVLEHMPFPRRGLQAARRLLKRDGILFVSMPNYNCPAWRMLDSNNANPYWGELEHYHNFSRRRLELLLQDEGFEAVSYSVSERYRACMELVTKRRSD